MNKVELGADVATKTGMTLCDSVKFIDATFDCIKEMLEKQEKVKIYSFGTFYVYVRKPWLAKNPHEPQKKFLVPTRKKPKFKASKILKDKIKYQNFGVEKNK